MKVRAIPYSAGELAWVEAHKALPRRELHARFVARFGREDVSQMNLTALCRRRGWRTGRTGKFEKGQTSWNKGRAGFCPPGSEKGWFRKGVRAGVAAHLYKPIGTERMSHEGYVERKINDDLPLRARWRAVHLIRWEEINGPVPEGHCLKCLDGDRANTDPANWVCLPRGLLPRLNGRYGRNFEGASPQVKPLILQTALLEHAAREARKSERKDRM